MDTKSGKAPANPTGSDNQKLCDLLLQVAGRDTSRLPSVRRHATVLAAALPFMNKAQAEVARQRIYRFETKWGSVLPGCSKEAEFTAERAELLVANWLTMRRRPEALLRVMHRAASNIWDGATKLLDIGEYAYATETDRIFFPPSYDSFREWMIQLRIAEFRHGGSFSPGILCRWWVEQMEPTNRDDTSYAACMTALMSLKAKPRFQR
jgi:hypothetical protein